MFPIIVCCQTLDQIKESFPRIYQEHKTLISHKHHNNPRFLITFSGVGGTGKGRLSQFLEEKMHAVRLSVHDIQKLFQKHLNLSPEEIDPSLMIDYSKYFLENLERHASNHLFILDLNVTKCWKDVACMSRDLSYHTFLIRLELDSVVKL